MSEAKRRIDLQALGIGGLNFRRALTGGCLLEISGEGNKEKADVLPFTFYASNKEWFGANDCSFLLVKQIVSSILLRQLFTFCWEG